MSSNKATSSTSQPISADLRRWVIEQLGAGHSVESLRQSMRKSGWHEDAIDVALFAVPADSPAAQSSVAPASLARQPARSPRPGPDLEGNPAYLDVGDRRVEVLMTLQDPRVVMFGNLLSDEECDGLIAAADSRLSRSLTVETKTGGEAVNQDRTSDGMFFERGENEIVHRIEARIARLLNWPVEYGEGLQVLRYRPGAQYRPHYDYFDPGEPGTPTILRRGGQRLGTLLMYLRAPEQGGGTVFPDVGVEIAAKRGCGVFFGYDRPDPGTRSLHGGSPVLAGEKWVATKWLREREFK
ncbi:2OG-Fe(II) oxygenase [Variovorax dokdonensis]|uniref:2OG-Fe(II) oxygenase n=1 Tax=Variovorax dokdonensis TaxID=344883 RepID=A0ABT7N6D3_9BURK|nr:2OG-Fe(II) oxygenase [Variovorax dokdonensis]MDM0043501.1 2OG-Fe(II) oxygenase [Variovorax dokdonensis]